MQIVNRFMFVIGLIVFSLVITGCQPKCNYTSSQPMDEYEQIELIYISADGMGSRYDDAQSAAVLGVVDLAQCENMFEDIKKVSCSTHILDPSFSISGYVIRIIYRDGSFELISNRSVAVYDNGEWTFKSHILNDEQFAEFIKKVMTVYMNPGDNGMVCGEP